MLVSVITAMYYEEDSVPQLLNSYKQLLSITPPDIQYQFVFVDDGSRDNTLPVLRQLLPSFLNNKIVVHEINKGFGAALRTGIANSDGEIIVCYDADSTYPVSDILILVSKVRSGWDVATANPFHESKLIENVPIWRQSLTWANAALYKMALGKGSAQASIFSCAFRAYRADVIKSIQFRSNGFGAASEILGRLILKGYKVLEVPSTLTTRQFGESKMNVRKAVFEHLKNVRLFFNIRYLNK
jgi:glycosyltransferase involved in cell wall biosynthesis